MRSLSVQILPAGSPTPGGQAWVNPGNSNLFTDASLNGGFGTLGNNGIYFKTNGINRAYLDRNGIAPETGTSVGIGIDPSDSNRITYFSGGGGSTPTWQQTLTAGSTLNTNNTIIMGNTSFIWSCGVGSSLEATIGQFSLETFQGGVAFSPYNGEFHIDTLNNETFQNTIMGWTSTSGLNRGKIGYITIGSGLSLSSGTLSSNGSANLTSTYIGYGSGSNTLTGDANLTYTPASSAVVLDSGYLSFTGNKDFGSSVTGSIFKSSLYGLTFRGVPGASYDLLFFSQGGSTLFANPTGTTQMGTVGDWGFGLLGSTISAKVHITAGTASAGTAPLKFNQGTNLTSPEAGAMEWNGTNLFITQTTGPTRQTIAYASDLTFWNLNGTSTLTGGVTIDGSANGYDLKGNKSGINIANRITTIGDYLVGGVGTRIIVDESNDKLFMISAAISGATTGDALTVADPTTGEIGVAPNLAFNFMKENTMIYAKNGRLWAEDADKNLTQISPHNDKGEWIYKSVSKDGVTTEINMIRLAELLEKVTGEKLIYKTKE